MGDLLDRAATALALAQELGIDDVALSLERDRTVEVAYRDGTLENLRESVSMGLTATLFQDGRYSSSSTCDLRPDALRAFLRRSAELTSLLAPDPHRGLADPVLYEGQADVDLRQVDPEHGRLDPGRQLALAEALQRSAADGEHVISATGTAVDAHGERALVTSNGFAGEEQGTAFWIGAQVTVGDGVDRRPAGSWWAATAHHGELPEPEGVGRQALQRALRQRGSGPATTLRCPMVVENVVARRLLAALLGPLSGQSLQQHRSFLEGKQGQTVASPLLTLVDDPLIPAGLASRLFDSEGIVARRLPLIEGGVLRNYLLDTYYARKLGRKPTTGAPSNLVVTPGDRGLDALLVEADGGVLVTSFLGGNSDPTTGDYSFGVRGHRIEDGTMGAPVSEMNITGSLPRLLQRLVRVGDDPYPYASQLVPSLLFDDVQFSGL
jgi:PmbA protein